MANTECTSPPPPRIGKIGPYTVFMTPPPTPKSGSTELPPPIQPQPVQTPPVQVVDKSCPVWSPPMQYDKPSQSSFGFFWNAVAKVQNAHASLDEQVAYWFGLNQSKYQWALDDYYESKNIGHDELLVLCIKCGGLPINKLGSNGCIASAVLFTNSNKAEEKAKVVASKLENV